VSGWAVRAEVLAQSGFNDARGAQSDADADSPYALGTALRDQPANEELGWAGPWAHESMTSIVQSDVVFEGDGAIVQGPGFSAAARPWLSAVEAGRFGVQLALRVEANAAANFFIGDGGHVSAHWAVAPGGAVLVFDGNDAPAPGFEPTVFQLQPDVWHMITVLGHQESRSWRLFVDGVEHQSQDALGFRSIDAPAFAQSYYWFDTQGGRTYVDAIRVFIPDGIMLEGTAEGGRLCAVIRSSVSERLPRLCTTTRAGQSAGNVLRQLAAEVNADPALAENGVHAVVTDDVFVIGADIERVEVNDEGLSQIGEQTGVMGRGALIAVLLLATGAALAWMRAQPKRPGGA
jgi:hypothetical protein